MHTYNQTGAGPNPATRVKKVLANLLLAQDHATRLRMNTTHIKIVLDGRHVKNLLSTWRMHAARAGLLAVAAKSRGTCGGKNE
jgi:hypothetical protein